MAPNLYLAECRGERPLMRICIVYQGGEFPPSERIEKSAKSLCAAGHEVFLLCNNYGKFALHEEQVGAVHVMRIWPTLHSRILNKIIKFPIFLNPLWITQLLGVVRRFRIQALQVVDIPLAPAVLALGRAFGLPVIMDMWENYPEALRGWARKDWKYVVFKNYRVARAVELWTVRRVDQIITVVEEQKQRLIADGVPPERISVVPNGYDEELFTAGEVRHDTAMDAEPNAYKLLYAGVVSIERGLEDVIRALKRVLAILPNVRLFIAGNGSDESRLRSIAASEGVAYAVRFLGWVPFNDIQSYVAKSDLCLVPHVNNDFINTTIPNKIFQYMGMSKPVLVSNARPLARIVNECDGGFVFRSGDPGDAATKILEAYRARDDKSIGARAYHHVRQKYTWERCATELIAVYERFAQRSDFRKKKKNFKK